LYESQVLFFLLFSLFHINKNISQLDHKSIVIRSQKKKSIVILALTRNSLCPTVSPLDPFPGRQGPEHGNEVKHDGEEGAGDDENLALGGR